MAYRKFDTGTWQDPWFEDLSPEAKLAFIYLWTNETCNQAGIYEISEKRIKFELGYGIDTIYSELDTKIFWDKDKKTIWVKNFFKRQCQNYKFAISALNSIKDDPGKLKVFIEYNQEFIESFKDKNGKKYIDISRYLPDTISIPYPTEAEQNRTEQIQNKETIVSCPEPEKPGSTPEPDSSVILSEPFCEIPLSGGKGKHVVTENDIAEYQEAYPGIDVRQEIRKCQQWNKASPTRRKTKKGIKRHVTAWLGRAQDTVRAPPQPKTRTDRNKQACMDFIQGAPDAK